MRNQISFKQFNPSKPAKYELLFKSINAARYPYTFGTALYAGKPQNEGGQFYHPGIENVTKYLTECIDGTLNVGVQHIFRPIVHIVHACDVAFEQKACDLHWYTDGKWERHST